MTIDEVIANIDNTIKGKLLLKESIQADKSTHPNLVGAFVAFIGLNVVELRNIRADLVKVKEANIKA